MRIKPSSSGNKLSTKRRRVLSSRYMRKRISLEMLEDRCMLSGDTMGEGEIVDRGDGSTIIIPGDDEPAIVDMPVKLPPPNLAALPAFLPVGVSQLKFANEVERELGEDEDVNLVDVKRPEVEPGGGFTSLIIVNETEPNDAIAGANAVPLGFDPGEDTEVDVTGVLDPPVAPTTITPNEDDGSLPMANATGLATGNAVIASATIGDGPFGATNGDYDWYQVPGVTTGQIITADIDASINGSTLDSIVVVYDSAGNILAGNDDDGTSLDSFLVFTAPADDDYFVVVLGFGPTQNDPLDSSSGSGVFSTGPYDLTIGLDAGDADFFEVQLNAGDIFGASVTGAQILSFQDANGAELIGSGGNITGIHPASSPLPGTGNAALSWVVDTTGTYYVRAVGGQGNYTLNLRVFRPELEAGIAGEAQTLFLDFDGATLDTSIFGGAGTATLSPLSTFLPNWGLTAADEDAVIDAIVASVIESISTDMRVLGNNGDFATSGTPGEFDIQVLNSRDDADPWGQPNVSRVIVGGTIGELGIGTIGIAESIDVGNFETEETAVTLLDLLSAPAFDPNSLNQYTLDPSVTIIDLIGVGVGNITAHEAGHFLADWHTDQTNNSPNIMDQGGNLANTIGIGPDNIFGTADDIDVDFGDDTYVPNEGFTGTEDTLNAIAFGLSTGTINPATVGQIQGLVFDDQNGDGILDPGEPGLNSWRVYSDTNDNGAFDIGEPDTFTAPNGTYNLIVQPGDHIIREELQLGWNQTLPDPAIGSYSVTVAAGEIVTDIDFGNEFAGLVVTSTTSNGNALRDFLLGSGVTPAGNATFIGSNSSAGFFDGGLSSIGIESGIILSTGDANFAQGPNFSDFDSGIASGTGDPDLSAEFGVLTQDTTVLEFSFDAAGGDLSFNFVFASEEYNEFANSTFNDVFAFFIDGQNIGLIPGTNTPISINTINGGNPFGTGAVNGQFYNNNDPSDGGQFLGAFGMDGFTDIFTAERKNLSPGQHTIKLAISDVGDFSFDTAVFIQASSFSVGSGEVSGDIWEDTNGDGIRDTDEPGQAGVVVYLDIDEDGTIGIGEPGAITDANGHYVIEGIEPGIYTVRQVVEPSLVQTSPIDPFVHTVEIIADDVFEDIDFSNRRVLDFGDAPGPYPTLLADNGPSHGVLPGFQLGAAVDGEFDGVPDEAAEADDDAGPEFVPPPVEDDDSDDDPTGDPDPMDEEPIEIIDDEDGVTFVSQLIIGTEVETIVNASRPGVLQGWLDFNADGDWSDPGEQLFTDLLLAGGDNTLSFEVPLDAAVGETYARFRFSFERGISFTGPTRAGEVEDYKIRIQETFEEPAPVDPSDDDPDDMTPDDQNPDNGTPDDGTPDDNPPANSEQPFQNADNPFDVDGDGIVRSLDLLRLIRNLNDEGNRPLAMPSKDQKFNFVDISGDNFANPLDIVLMIRELNRIAADPSSGDSAEGEAESQESPATEFNFNGAFDSISTDASGTRKENEVQAAERSQVENDSQEVVIPDDNALNSTELLSLSTASLDLETSLAEIAEDISQSWELPSEDDQ